MFIQTGLTPNEDVIKFMIVGKTILNDNAKGRPFVRGEDNSQSPMAQEILLIDNISEVFVANDFVSITRINEEDWTVLKPQVTAIISDYVSNEKPVMLDQSSSSENKASEYSTDSVENQIIELLTTRIAPALAQDGGGVKFIGYNDGIVELELQGACNGCSSAIYTLRNGIENMIRFYIPEVQKVVAKGLDEEAL